MTPTPDVRPWTEADFTFMRRALQLAAQGEGWVEPNPMVGAVIVQDAGIIAEGRHERYGGPHAEVQALGQARERGAEVRGATMYVSLEPCCHWGKTPPCTDAIRSAGITRVVAAMEDPFPKVAGGGVRTLQDAGIDVRVGLLGDDARRLNAPFLKRVATGRPWIILKWAQSLDGKIATRTGESRWITSERARQAAHALRGRVDAIVVGAGTVIADDPELTCRLATPRRVALRVVLDPRLRMPPTARLVRTARDVPTVVFTTGAAPEARMADLKAAGCDVIVVEAAAEGVSINAVVDELGRRGMTNVMVEGGGRVLGSFFDARLADEAYVFIAPRLIGGAAAPGPLEQSGSGCMNAVASLQVVRRECLDPDELWQVRL